MVIIIYDNFIVSPSLASVEEVLALYKLAQQKSTKISYLMYKNVDYLGFYNNNNSECNRCELAGVRNNFLTKKLYGFRRSS